MDRTTEMLSAYACSLTYEELGHEVVEQVKRTLVDTMGCAIGGYESEPAAIARSLADGVHGGMASRVLGTAATTTPDLAAFANGVAVRYLDCNDSYFSPGGGHPSDMIPAVLAVAVPLRSDGPTVITAIALAYEVFCRLSDEVVAGDLGWDQGIFSVIGAACGAARVMGLDEEQTGNAISLAITPHLPLGVTRTGELSMWKGCAAASASRSAVFAAQLAAKGMSGPDEAFEGRRGLWEQAVGREVAVPDFPLGNARGNDDTFRITRTIFKAYPSQIHTQAPIGLALQLRERVSAPDIQAVHIDTYNVAASTASSEPEKWDPKTRETADHSIPWLVASALLDGPVTPDSFAKERIASAAIRDIMSRMTLLEEPDFTARYPGEYNSRITVADSGGSIHTAHTSWPRGHRRNPMDDSEVESKFRNFAGAALTSEQCDRALEAIRSLDRLPDLETVLDSLIIRS
jgi:2-methylcitrate dehydratase